MEYSTGPNPLLDPLPQGGEQNPRNLYNRVVQLALLVHDQNQQWWSAQLKAQDEDPEAWEAELQRLDPQKFVAMWNQRYSRRYPLDKLETFPARQVFLALLGLLAGT